MLDEQSQAALISPPPPSPPCVLAPFFCLTQIPTITISAAFFEVCILLEICVLLLPYTILPFLCHKESLLWREITPVIKSFRAKSGIKAVIVF